MSLCKVCASQGDAAKCTVCKHEGTLRDNFVPMTNMHCIRAMDVRELAKFIVSCYIETCCKHCIAEHKRTDNKCSGEYCIGKSEEDIVVEWLLSPAKEAKDAKGKK